MLWSVYHCVSAADAGTFLFVYFVSQYPYISWISLFMEPRPSYFAGVVLKHANHFLLWFKIFLQTTKINCEVSSLFQSHVATS